MASETIDNVRAWIGANHKTIAVALGGVFISVKVGTYVKQMIEQKKREEALKKFENAPRDVVIFHTLSRGKTIPNLSPFAMKLETFLRMSKIPYEIDYELPTSSLGKTPWITLNGEHIADSQIIVEFLKKKYNIGLGNYSEEELALGRTVRIMMDEYLYWGIALWRYVHSEGKGLDKIFNMPPPVLKAFYQGINKRVVTNSWAQGIGRHSKEQIMTMMKETLKNASLILGNKKFLLGDQPSQDDCSFFGFIGMVLWATPGSPYEKYLKEELPNLEEYCLRMKERFWSDWEQRIVRLH